MGKKFTDKQIHILDIAEELIAKKGYEGTSVRDICSKANINVAMISYYFGSKEKNDVLSLSIQSIENKRKLF